jgi:Family of unknown function (DUF6459)
VSSTTTDDPTGARLATVPEGVPPYDGEPGGWAQQPVVPLPGSAPLEQGRVAGAGAAEDWQHRFAQTLAEVLAGSRPARQIIPCTTERARLHLGRIGPLFAGGQCPRVLRTRPRPDVVEMSAIVTTGQRTRALAVRFERHAPGRWLCTDIEGA